ncbi:TPA: hypothetical protein TUM56_001513 [Streptococcus equi subsp. zooepidemicus]|uniref:Uncharacterized protein n=3 Tax=Streptococcus equi subsp. zooepidemicus TaxID=40041 RepID=B4U0T1_STREM|nr:hypothetical protein [Streptococcus equi]ACG61618.1 hypothetical protein Sez_0240 [Streptococcus equi subsp. zooepidemicus MGCS10565]MCD3415040.1 hypothetical protein [Streptococcus equi subsp. zooepidemicus]MCD3428900.1 hypothetical protein [Streptococcus equi subsp. zooepidemicus]MCD3464204.1 hypothetical protein [Streptococcus equi subsp. zooepidemicus]MDI5913445.1 hypothetical protein [Streptococcus equi subsp. zooepidemicus]
MGITQMTWEEYETFNKVETSHNFYIREHNGTYYTVFELGIASVRRIFELSAADFEEYLKGLRTADEILFKVQNDCWPPTEEEKNRIMRERAKDRPMVLISNPKNQMLFTQEELSKLIPIAEQKWINWKGKLPDDYISPLK